MKNSGKWLTDGKGLKNFVMNRARASKIRGSSPARKENPVVPSGVGSSMKSAFDLVKSESRTKTRGQPF